ncbi:minor tail protein [Mycobacterium phage MyraDee]|uniref:Glycine-rich domain-containing protein n=1 Tax=Mycobacterium phage MyraDee TaxID=2024303 RepID=A0A222YYX1_9CAUD|nr:minor tail protein [Mycobacterium phage MyraDee]ASR77113.1 hypothetical protein SEA_MYRADEE_5 [Mycobacterium phage MyraDee]
MGTSRLNSAYPPRIYLGTSPVSRCFLGNELVWLTALVGGTQTFTTVGAFAFDIPNGARYIDYVLLGAGGGGGNGSLFLPGNGGAAGQWLVGTLERGVDLPWSVTQLLGSVGAPGAAGSGGGATNGGNGGATILSSLSAPGGSGGAGWGNGTRNGASPSPVTQNYNGFPYTAGTGGSGAGGVGAGGASQQGTAFGNRDGFVGGRGQAWLRAFA